MSSNTLYDAVIIGGGPSGLTAALYLARARYRVVVVEKERFGGQIATTEEVVNYPGVERTSGSALTETMRKQAESFGAEFLLAEATKLELGEDVKKVHTSRGTLECFAVLLATGAHPRTLGFPGEDTFRGRGVAYCATCDGEFFTGKQVFAIGGGFAAAEESVFLTKYATNVTIMMRKGDFSCADSVADAARAHDKITIMPYTVVEEVSGSGALTRVVAKNTQTGELTEFNAPEGENFGVFVFAGYEPATELIADVAEIDAQGYVITPTGQATTVPGLFAAGDVCQKSLRQVATAVGDGALAATEIEHWAAAMEAKTGLTPKRPTAEDAAAKKAAEAEAKAAAAAAKAGAGANAGGGASASAAASGSYLDASLKPQLDAVFDRMASSLTLEVYTDDRPVAQELRGYMEELAAWTDKLNVVVRDAQAASTEGIGELPCVRVMREDGSWSGLAFHGVPGGHEFTSFVLGLYNAAGPGQPIDPATLERAKAIASPTRMQLLVTLSCTMCPDLVVAAQRIAAENPQVVAEVYDANHFPELKERYQVMSVPCLVINEDKVSFGKKTIEQVLDLIS